MGTTDPRVDAYIQNAAPFAKPILAYIRRSVHAGCPEVEETMKWEFSSLRLQKSALQPASLNDNGVKIARPKRPVPKPAPKAPADLQKALKANAAALANFTALSPSHKREYIEWITEAKTEPTRQKRMATTIQWLAEGKSRNWKYERKQ